MFYSPVHFGIHHLSILNILLFEMNFTFITGLKHPITLPKD